jgi:hypothetical protein
MQAVEGLHPWLMEQFGVQKNQDELRLFRVDVSTSSQEAQTSQIYPRGPSSVFSPQGTTTGPCLFYGERKLSNPQNNSLVPSKTRTRLELWI